MNVDSMMIDPGPLVYYTDAMRNVLEDHMTYLRNHPTTAVYPIPPNIANQYKNDFKGLMQFLNIPPHLAYVVLRMNQYTSDSQNPMDLETLLIPDENTVSFIQQSFSTVNKLNG